MNSENLFLVSASESSLYHLETLPSELKPQLTSCVFKAVQADISRNLPLANTVLLKYLTNQQVFDVENLKSLCELLKLAIIASIDTYPKAALSYTEAAADCVNQIKKRIALNNGHLKIAI